MGLSRFFGRKAANDNTKGIAYYSDIAALTKDFGGNGATYEEHRFCTVEPDNQGNYNVYTRVGGKVVHARLGENTKSLLESSLSAKQAFDRATQYVTNLLESRPQGKEIGQMSAVKGIVPLKTDGLKWKPLRKLETNEAKATGASAVPS